MKQYIFLTENIKGAGGVQCYVAAKAKYLHDKGWKVIIISSTTRNVKHCLIKSLDEYLNGDIFEICLPPFKYPKWYQLWIIKKIRKVLGTSIDCEEVIIESHNAATSQWGEILASRIGARHFFYLMNEHYRGKGKYYEAMIDFYKFKFQRREILGSQSAKARLLKGYVEVNDLNAGEDLLIDEAPIQDVESIHVNALQKLDWNICYLGRGNKPYVENIIKGIGRFAEMNSEKKIQFVVVGDFDMHKELVKNILLNNTNLVLTELGFLFPLPRKIYDKIDVFIAGSGSARHSAEEGALVIIPDTETKLSNGLYGYETYDSVYKGSESVVSTFEEALKRVLVDKVYENLPNCIPAKMGVDKCTEQNFELYAKAKQEREYYPEKIIMAGKTDWKRFLGVLALRYFPFVFRYRS